MHNYILALYCLLAFHPFSGDDWQTGSATDAGFNEEALARIKADIGEGLFTNTHSLLIEHDGLLIYEEYFNGSDQRWGVDIGEIQFNANNLHDLRSISKSVTSMLLGIALEEQFKSKSKSKSKNKKRFEKMLERSVADYFPDVKFDKAHKEITLQHLLTMTAGIPWNEVDVPYSKEHNDERLLYLAVDPVEFVLTRELESAPGKEWVYNGGLTQVAASIIRELTGKDLTEYAREKLFQPLGITDFEWLGPGNWQPSNPAAMSGLRMRPRDLAKLGSLILHQGKWRKKQIVNEAWVELSTTRFVQDIGDWSQGGVYGYGLQWWVGTTRADDKLIAAVGNGNQRVYILPNSKLVITIFAGEYGKHEFHSERLLDRVIAAHSQ
ncbi:MAG: serine hydrolase [Planctomycetes bacterium]|nr:serine hydrolase [Planctomycetota bacterium]